MMGVRKPQPNRASEELVRPSFSEREFSRGIEEQYGH